MSSRGKELRGVGGNVARGEMKGGQGMGGDRGI
jgi:hypothetical protein